MEAAFFSETLISMCSVSKRKIQ